MKKYSILFVIILFLLNINNTVSADEKLKSNQYKQTIAIDLDGVLNEYSKYEPNNIPKIKDGAREFIQTLYKDGYRLILFTNRKTLSASQWLIDNDLEIYFTDVTNVKPKANIYLDDRALKFSGDYTKTLKDINNFTVYWQ